MSPQFLSILCLFMHGTNGYFMSMNTFEWQIAESYCMQHCGSHLASIHSDASNQEAKDVITYTLNRFTQHSFQPSSQPPDYPDPYYSIGITDLGGNGVYTWSDGTAYNYSDFNNNTNGCGAFDQGYPPIGQWTTLDCDFGNSQNEVMYFLCNHCNGKLTKYAIIDDVEQWNDVGGQEELTAECGRMFNTELASIHNLRDHEEAQLLMELGRDQSFYSNNDEAYIGLDRTSRDPLTFVWQDGTTFDYGSTYYTDPWVDDEPGGNQDCAKMDNKLVGSLYLWKDISCFNIYAGICNAPSEICFESEWYQVSGIWTFSTIPCQVSSTYSVYNVAILGQKRWDNGGEPFIVEYIYTITTIGSSGGTAGIIWHVDANDASCTHYYYVGIGLSSGQSATVFLAQVKNLKMNIMQSAALGFVYSLGIYYTLTVEIANTNTFTITVNNGQAEKLPQLSGTSINSNIGYIGMKNTDSAMTAKSLFMSGTPVQVSGNNPDLWFDECPTAEPTESPTTGAPTTSDPTTTTAATTATSDNPSNVPSGSPTKSPTRRPTETLFTCTNTNEATNTAIITISFAYIAHEDATVSYITSTLYSTADTLMEDKEKELTNCEIYDHETTINIEESTNKASVNITVCTTCDEDQLSVEEDDLTEITNGDEGNGILVVDGSTEISVDIIDNNEAGVNDASTTSFVSDTSAEKDGDNALWGIVGAILGIVIAYCIVILIVFWIKKKKVAEKLERNVNYPSNIQEDLTVPQNNEMAVDRGDGDIRTSAMIELETHLEKASEQLKDKHDNEDMYIMSDSTQSTPQTPGETIKSETQDTAQGSV